MIEIHDTKSGGDLQQELNRIIERDIGLNFWVTENGDLIMQQSRSPFQASTIALSSMKARKLVARLTEIFEVIDSREKGDDADQTLIGDA